MASYRYCRSDDVALLAQAFNECYRVHFPDEPEMTVERFKRLQREIDLWTSSCMIAREGEDLVAVMLATKRDEATLILNVGVRPGHQRRGHGRHLLGSLSQKLAILGPPLILAEVPHDWSEAGAFMRACGFREQAAYTDWVLSAPEAAGERSPLVVPVTLDELAAAGALRSRDGTSWAHTPRTIARAGARLSGLAIAPAERIEAYLLFEPDDARAGLTVRDFDTEDPGRAAVWLRLLLRHACDESTRQVTVERLSSDDPRIDSLRDAGFHPGATTAALAATPTPA